MDYSLKSYISVIIIYVGCLFKLWHKLTKINYGTDISETIVNGSGVCFTSFNI